jgi:hypothetical protein
MIAAIIGYRSRPGSLKIPLAGIAGVWLAGLPVEVGSRLDAPYLLASKLGENASSNTKPPDGLRAEFSALRDT